MTELAQVAFSAVLLQGTGLLYKLLIVKCTVVLKILFYSTVFLLLISVPFLVFLYMYFFPLCPGVCFFFSCKLLSWCPLFFP